MNDEFNNNVDWTSFTPSFPVRKQMLVILSAAAPGGLSFALRRFLSSTPTFFLFRLSPTQPSEIPGDKNFSEPSSTLTNSSFETELKGLVPYSQDWKDSTCRDRQP